MTSTDVRTLEPAPGLPGEGVLELEVVELRRESERVLSVLLADPARRLLPAWTPGAHIDLGLPDHVRQYSLCGDPADRRGYRIAVLREPASRGGSEYVHAVLRPGEVVEVGGPRNHFPLVEAAEYVFVAGGIGITPLLPMIEAVTSDWQLFYCGRSPAFLDRLGGDPRVVVRQNRFDLAAVLGEPRPGVAVYCCGPAPLLAAMEVTCADWPPGTLHLERFTAAPRDPAALADDVPFDLVARRSGVRVTVPAGESALDVLEAAGVALPNACRDGLCGSCESRVLAGLPEHRDVLLDPDVTDRVLPCVSRARTPELVLDI
ncbi:PDR/VanB family oxidoreductase [Pseudonocardia sp. WMMC193]|uniref:PDR/VanB family oxidoreductase n=1 Tax=Pseudonocardia sp. WMMC193 TaxID=2911965 RepID=UPI001F28E51C|nr:PDR/VanB family oxidoreductase [Pseudonocardia sp. WMMC193]MCF7548020.1 PDR/VanB family oxidoreductase [Pseudonocardia sp. WMMC193]